MSIARDILHQTATTAATTLFIQLSTFSILAMAPLMLSDREFAQLAVIVAATMLSNAFFDFGLNLTSTKFFGESRDKGWLISAYRIRLLCLPLAGILALLAALPFAAPGVGSGIFCGAFLNLWNGVRTTDQAQQDYVSFSRISMIFASLRVVAGSVALFVFRDPIAIVLGLYVVPVLAIRASNSWQLLAKAPRHGDHNAQRMLGYAFNVYLNALIFVGLPYMPQFIIAERFDDLAAGTYGLIITFTAPISLLIYSLRAVLLPKMLNQGNAIETSMWSRNGVLAIAGIAILFCLGGAVVAMILDQIYGHRFPDIGGSFTIFFIGFAITSAVGLYSLSVHTLGVPHIAMWIAVAKIALLAVLLYFQGHSLYQVIVATSGVMIAGELLLAAYLMHTRRSITP